MKFTLDRPGTAYVVRGYTPGVIRIGERDVASSVIVSATTLIEPWRPRHAGELAADDLEPAVALAPEVLLIGTGPRQVFPAATILAALHRARIGFEVMDTGAACRTYNLLLAEDRRVAAALIVG
jgi:uncharacterized protein